jgi:hypothetical protein
MNEVTPKHIVYVLEDRDFYPKHLESTLSPHFPTGAEFRVFRDSQSLLDDLELRVARGNSYDLVTDMVLNENSAQYSRPRLAAAPAVNAALWFAKIVETAGAELTGLTIQSCSIDYAQEGASDVHALRPDVVVVGRDKRGFELCWDRSYSNAQPVTVPVKAAFDFDEVLNQLKSTPPLQRGELLANLHDHLRNKQRVDSDGFATLGFEESCGQPCQGYLAYTLEDVARNHQKGKASIWVRESFGEDIFAATGQYEIAGFVFEREPIKGHLPILLAGQGLSALIGSETMTGGRPAAQSMVTLDPVGKKLVYGPAALPASVVDDMDAQQTSAFLNHVNSGQDNAIGPHVPQLRINASGPGDLEIARGFLCPIGLMRSEHFLLSVPENRALLRDVLLERPQSAGALSHMYQGQTEVLKQAMQRDGLTLRLLDLSPEELFTQQEQEALRARYGDPLPRGVQMARQKPELYRAQIGAVMKVAVDQNFRALTVLVPGVRDASDIGFVRDMIGPQSVPVRVGAMIETLSSCENIKSIAAVCDTVSFGTNDLTAEFCHLSRYDPEQRRAYVRKIGLPKDPFVTLHPEVSALVATTALAARAANPELEIGLCGDHATDRMSLYRLLPKLGTPVFNYLSVSPSFQNLVIGPLVHYRDAIGYACHEMGARRLEMVPRAQVFY